MVNYNNVIHQCLNVGKMIDHQCLSIRPSSKITNFIDCKHRLMCTIWTNQFKLVTITGKCR